MKMSDKYLSLIPAQHRSAPSFTQWISTYLGYTDPLHEILVTLDSYFDLDLATGEQLDILGSIVGVSRVLNYTPPVGQSPILEDELYRVIIKCRIIKNHWDGKEETLYALWAKIFDTAIIIQDNQDMSFWVVIVSPITSTIRMRELAEHGYIVPKPQGVRINFGYLEEGPIFAYDSDTSMLKGYNRNAKWVESGVLIAYGYNKDEYNLQGWDTGKYV